MVTTSAPTGSSIDVASIVSQLMSVEQKPLTALAAKEASYQAKLSAFGTIKGALSSFQTAVFGLTNASAFQSLSATPSDSNVVTASAAPTATPGTFTLEVSRLAQAQKLVAAGQSSQTAAIGGGADTTLTFDFGTITGTLNPTTGKYSAGPTSTVASGAFSVPTSVSGTGTYALTIDGLNLQAPVTVDAGGTVVTAATLDASLTTFLAAHAGYSKTGSFATNDLVLTKADGTAIGIATTLGGDTAAGTFAGAGFVGVTAASPASFLSNGNGTKTVTIGATNNSLQGIRDAINSAKIGVTATIVNDGGASPYRLALSSDNIGKTNSIKISVAGEAALSNLLAHDPANVAGQNFSETTTGQNAEFKVNGIAVSKASNTITDVIDGVTLNLQKISAAPVNVTVARNTSSASSLISGFVKAYNDLSKTLQNVSAYDPATKKGAILQGDSTVRSLQTEIRAVLNTSVSNTGGSLTTLPQIGVSFQKDGTLALDTSKLNAAISSNFSDIASLFATVGKSSDSLVTYNSATSSTKPGSYAINLNTVATKGSLTDGVTVAGLVIDGTNNTLDVMVDGRSATVTLSSQTYASADALAAEVQSKINGASALSSAGVSVTVAQSGGIFSITSNAYGSASGVTATGNGASNLLGSPVPTNGVDVTGSIGGLSTTGSGQLLTATEGDANGINILVKGGATGARGTVNYSQGYAYTLNKLTTSMLSIDGILNSRSKGINSNITDIGKQRTALNTRLASIQANYTKQFSALDTMMSSMNATSNYLSQQLANLPKNTN